MENRLASFIVDLATSASALESYKADPETAMAQAQLSEQQKKVLRAGDWNAICEFLGDDEARPLTVLEEGSGTGDAGGDSSGG